MDSLNAAKVEQSSPKNKKLSSDENAKEENLNCCEDSSQNKMLLSAIFIQTLVTTAISFIEVADGVILGFTGIALPSMTDPDSGDMYLTKEQVPIYSSAIMVGATLASFLTAHCSVKYGQRVSLIIAIPVAIISWLISYFSNYFWLHIISRISLGIFMTFANSCSVNYVAETVNSNIRGRFMAIPDLARQLGILFVFIVGSANLHWRTIGLVCGLSPLIIPLAFLFFIPDSPRWLATKNKDEELIKEALRYFRGKTYNVTSELVEIKEDLKKYQNKESSLDQLRLMKQKSILKRFLFLAYLLFALNFTGNLALLTYSTAIFQSANTGISEYTSTIICGVARVLGMVCYIALSDRFGRRPLAIIFFFLCAICTVLLGVYFYFEINSMDTSRILWLPVTSLVLYTFFSQFAHSVVRLLRSELLPNSVRNIGVNLLFFVFGIGNFLIVLTYPIMVDYIGPHWTFWIFSTNNLMIIAAIYFFLPETKGKTLEEIELLYQKKE